MAKTKAKPKANATSKTLLQQMNEIVKKLNKRAAKAKKSFTEMTALELASEVAEQYGLLETSRPVEWLLILSDDILKQHGVLNDDDSFDDDDDE